MELDLEKIASTTWVFFHTILLRLFYIRLRYFLPPKLLTIDAITLEVLLERNLLSQKCLPMDNQTSFPWNIYSILFLSSHEAFETRTSLFLGKTGVYYFIPESSQVH